MSSMNRLLVLAAIVVSACAGAVVSQLVIPPAHAGVTQRWEYLCFDGGTYDGDREATSKRLNDAGREGWELATAMVPWTNINSHHAYIYCMKRPAP